MNPRSTLWISFTLLTASVSAEAGELTRACYQWRDLDGDGREDLFLLTPHAVSRAYVRAFASRLRLAWPTLRPFHSIAPSRLAPPTGRSKAAPGHATLRPLQSASPAGPHR